MGFLKRQEHCKKEIMQIRKTLNTKIPKRERKELTGILEDLENDLLQMGKLFEVRGDLAIAHGLRTYDALRGLLKGVNRIGFGTGRLTVRAEIKGIDFLKHLPPGLGEPCETRAKKEARQHRAEERVKAAHATIAAEREKRRDAIAMAAKAKAEALAKKLKRQAEEERYLYVTGARAREQVKSRARDGMSDSDMDNKAIGLTEENWRQLIDLCKERHGSTATTAIAVNNLAIILFENHMGAAPRQLECKMLIGEAVHMLEDYRMRMGDFSGGEKPDPHKHHDLEPHKGGTTRRTSAASPTHNSSGLDGFGNEEDSDEEEPEERPPEDLDMLLVLTILLTNMIYIIEGIRAANDEDEDSESSSESEEEDLDELGIARPKEKVIVERSMGVVDVEELDERIHHLYDQISAESKDTAEFEISCYGIGLARTGTFPPEGLAAMRDRMFKKKDIEVYDPYAEARRLAKEKRAAERAHRRAIRAARREVRRLYKERLELCLLVDLIDFMHDPNEPAAPPPPPPDPVEEDQAQGGKQVKSCSPFPKKQSAEEEKEEGESEGAEEMTSSAKKAEEEEAALRRASAADALFLQTLQGGANAGAKAAAARRPAPPRKESEFQRAHRLKAREAIKQSMFEEHGCETEDELADVRDRLMTVWEVPDDAAMQARMERLYDEEARARLAYCDFVDPKMASKLRGRLERKEEAAARAQEVLEMRKKQRARARYLAEQRKLKWGENKLDGDAEVGQGRSGQGREKPMQIPNLGHQPTDSLIHPPAHRPTAPPTHCAA